MTLSAAILLTAFHLDDEDLVAAALADDFSLSRRSRRRKGTACPLTWELSSAGFAAKRI